MHIHRLGVTLLVAVLNNKTTISKHTNSLCVVLLEARQVHWLVIYIRRSQSTGRLQTAHTHSWLVAEQTSECRELAPGPRLLMPTLYRRVRCARTGLWALGGKENTMMHLPACLCAGTLTAGWQAADRELGQQGPLRTFTLLYWWTMCMYYLFKKSSINKVI